MLAQRTLSLLLPLALTLSAGSSAQVKYAEFSYSAGDTGDSYGRGLALDGDLALVGAPSSPWFTGSLRGFVVVTNSRTGDELAVLVPSDSAVNDQFGFSVAMSSLYIVVGAPGAGAVYVFSRSTLQELYKVEHSAAFGYDVSVSGSTAIVGEPYAPSVRTTRVERASST